MSPQPDPSPIADLPRRPRVSPVARAGLIAVVLVGLLAAGCDFTEPGEDCGGVCLPDAGPDSTADDGVEPIADAGPAGDGEPTDAAAPDGGAREPGELALDLAAIYTSPAWWPGDVVERRVVLRNIGAGPLDLLEMRLDGSPSFAVRLNGVDPMADPTALADPDGDGTPGLSPAAEAALEVLFTVTEPQEHEDAELTIVSDGIEPRTTLPLRGNRAAPCVRVQPEVLSFGSTLVNRTDRRPLTVESCGATLPLELLALRWGDDLDGWLAFEEEPALPRVLPPYDDRAGGQPPPALRFELTFTPTASFEGAGLLLLETDDPERPRIQIPVSVRAVVNECPVPVVDGSGRFAVGDGVVLSGAASFDTDGIDARPVRYEWTLVERPEGSVATPLAAFDDPGDPASGGPAHSGFEPDARLYLDRSGTYRAELRVSDNLGLTAPGPGCPGEPAVVTIEAVDP